jgi:hypothetical protein
MQLSRCNREKHVWFKNRQVCSTLFGLKGPAKKCPPTVGDEPFSLSLSLSLARSRAEGRGKAMVRAQGAKHKESERNENRETEIRLAKTSIRVHAN